MFATIKSWLAGPSTPRNPDPNAPLGLEALGGRLVPAAVISATYYALSAVLAVEGTEGHDSIDVRQEAGRVRRSSIPNDLYNRQPADRVASASGQTTRGLS